MSLSRHWVLRYKSSFCTISTSFLPLLLIYQQYSRAHVYLRLWNRVLASLCRDMRLPLTLCDCSVEAVAIPLHINNWARLRVNCLLPDIDKLEGFGTVRLTFDGHLLFILSWSLIVNLFLRLRGRLFCSGPFFIKQTGLSKITMNLKLIFQTQ
jgi:hypothetical protein